MNERVTVGIQINTGLALWHTYNFHHNSYCNGICNAIVIIMHIFIHGGCTQMITKGKYFKSKLKYK